MPSKAPFRIVTVKRSGRLSPPRLRHCADSYDQTVTGGAVIGRILRRYPHDVSLLETTLAMTVDQRLERLKAYVRFVQAGRAALGNQP
jgi:hypothetical protein